MDKDVETPPDDDAQKNIFKSWFKEAVGEYLEENKPEPKRTNASPSIFDIFTPR